MRARASGGREGGREGEIVETVSDLVATKLVATHQ